MAKDNNELLTVESATEVKPQEVKKDSRFENALRMQSFIDQQFVTKENLRQRFVSRLVFSYNGGQFFCDTHLMGFLFAEKQRGITETVVLDQKNIPIRVNIEEFSSILSQKYHEIMNEYLIEYQALKKNRRSRRRGEEAA